MTLWMMVTSDKYELPLIVTDTAKELAIWAGVSPATVASEISRVTRGLLKTTRYVRVDLEDDDDV